MLNSAILEVILGMVFVYILLSLLVAQINNVIASLLNIRAEQLRQRVEDVIFDEDMQKRILGHPIVSITRPPRSSTQSPEDIPAADMETARVNKVKARTLAKATLNVLSDPFLEMYALVARVESDKEQARLRAAINQLKANLTDPARANAALNQLHEVITQLEPEDRRDRRALLRALGPLQGALRDYADENRQLLLVYEGIAQVNNVAFQRALETVLAGVGSVKEAETAITNWFDSKLEQTSDWYAMTMQYFSLFVGLAVAVLLNIDSLHIGVTLWNDDALRASVVQAANIAELSVYFDEAGNVITTPQANDAGEGVPTPTDNADTLARNYEAAQETLQQLLELRLPIGWTFRTPASVTEMPIGGTTISIYDPMDDQRNLYRFVAVGDPGWFGFVAGKLSGILVTGIATAQGAPFWFDILRRLTGQASPAQNKADAADENN